MSGVEPHDEVQSLDCLPHTVCRVPFIYFLPRGENRKDAAHKTM